MMFIRGIVGVGLVLRVVNGDNIEITPKGVRNDVDTSIELYDSLFPVRLQDGQTLTLNLAGATSSQSTQTCTYDSGSNKHTCPIPASLGAGHYACNFGIYAFGLLIYKQPGVDFITKEVNVYGGDTFKFTMGGGIQADDVPYETAMARIVSPLCEGVTAASPTSAECTYDSDHRYRLTDANKSPGAFEFSIGLLDASVRNELGRDDWADATSP